MKKFTTFATETIKQYRVMKIGSFVGKFEVELSNAEIDEIRNRIVVECNKVFGAGNFKIGVVPVALPNSESIHFYITPKVFDTNGFALRLTDGSQAKFNHIYFSVRKQKGYDEKVEGKFYEVENFNPNLNLESYTMNVCVYGNQKGYRKKNTDMNVRLMYQGNVLWRYTYGTELDDLFDDSVTSVLRHTEIAVNTGKKTKNVLRYW